MQMNRNGILGGSVSNQQQRALFRNSVQPADTQQQQSKIFSSTSNLVTGTSNSTAGGIFGSHQNHPRGPQVIPPMVNVTPKQTQQSQQPLNS